MNAGSAKGATCELRKLPKCSLAGCTFLGHQNVCSTAELRLYQAMSLLACNTDVLPRSLLDSHGQAYRCTDFWDMGYTSFIVDPAVRVAYEPDIAEGLHDPVKARIVVCRHHALLRCL